MPVLGIVASQISGHLFAPSGAYDSIATTTLSTSTATITFSSIPATYKHLQIRMICKDSNAGSYSGAISGAAPMYVRFNSDSGGNYASHQVLGNGSAVSAYGPTSITAFYVGSTFSNSNAATNNMFATAIIDILDYTDTSKYKTGRVLSGFNQNNAAGANPDAISLGSGLWMNTSAITSISLGAPANDFVQYSSFALYGIKGA